MVNWIVQNKEIVYFADGLVFSVIAFYAVYQRLNNHRAPSEKKSLLNVEDVFEQLCGASRFQCSDISSRYLGNRVKVVGRLSRVKKLTGEHVAISISPEGVNGCVSIMIPSSEYHKIASRDRLHDVAYEGEISYMNLDDNHELFLTDAKLHM